MRHLGRPPGLLAAFIARNCPDQMMYTLVASASRHNLDIWAYLNDVLRRLVGGKTDLESLLPDRWAASHPDSIRTYREAEQTLRAAKTKSLRARRRKLPNRK